jgi:hypothetical protein
MSAAQNKQKDTEEEVISVDNIYASNLIKLMN